MAVAAASVPTLKGQRRHMGAEAGPCSPGGDGSRSWSHCPSQGSVCWDPITQLPSLLKVVMCVSPLQVGHCIRYRGRDSTDGHHP